MDFTVGEVCLNQNLPNRRNKLLKSAGIGSFHLAMFLDQHFKVRKSISPSSLECIQDKGMLEHGFHPLNQAITAMRCQQIISTSGRERHSADGS